MTEDDDAFIRMIVDNPGNDLPRLVYADWLDDRDDPRGPFLRAEVEWAQPWKEGIHPGDITDLRGMAAKLDPLWVARVARPPVGVCCDHLRFVASGPRLRKKDVDEIDRWPEVKLPADYKAFLLNYNGGRALRAEHVPRIGRGFPYVLFGLFTFIPVIPPGDPKQRDTLHGDVQRYWDHELPQLLESLGEEETAIRQEYEGVIPIGWSEVAGESLMLGVAAGIDKCVHGFGFVVGLPLAQLLSFVIGDQHTEEPLEEYEFPDVPRGDGGEHDIPF